MLKHKLKALGITEKEYAGLQAILDSEYGDGWGPDKAVWSWSANPFTNLRSAGGVFASLAKKGLVSADGWGEEATLQHTDKGFKTWVRATYEAGSEVPIGRFSDRGLVLLDEALYEENLVSCHERQVVQSIDELEEELGDEVPDEAIDQDDLDGDHESGLASAGFGTDEDYGGDDERLDD